MLEAVLLLLILAIDQISKHFTILYLKPLGSIPILDSVLSLTYVENRGASFGMLQGHQWLFLVITALVVLVICWFLLSHRNEPLFLRLALTFLAAGALGNQIDRIFRGFVVDMIHFQIPFPVFNVADSFVSIGTVMIIGFVLFFSHSSPFLHKNMAASKQEGAGQ